MRIHEIYHRGGISWQVRNFRLAASVVAACDIDEGLESGFKAFGVPPGWTEQELSAVVRALALRIQIQESLVVNQKISNEGETRTPHFHFSSAAADAKLLLQYGCGVLVSWEKDRFQCCLSFEAFTPPTDNEMWLDAPTPERFRGLGWMPG